MKDKRLWIGGVVTVVWFGFAAYMFVTVTHPKDLNSWGDFFAGFFAPMAFLWLVLGYFQQGEELRHSTEALRLQAEELRNSVEQQSQLVAVSREQVQHELRSLEEDRERRRDAARPKFVPQHSGTAESGSAVDYKMKLVNVGNTATKFRMQFDPHLEKPAHHNIALVARDEVVSVDLRFALAASTTATIKYYDADGLPGEVQFSIQAIDRSLILGEVNRVL